MELVKLQIFKMHDNNLKSQFVTSSWGGKRKLPYAFTEQGIYMLATVLKGELAVQQSIFIMRAFKEMRHYIQQNQQFITRAEHELLSLQTANYALQIAALNDRQNTTEASLHAVQKSIDALNENFITEKDWKNFVVYKGEKFEADIAYIDIYMQAQKSIYVIDDYVNHKTLQLLSHKNLGVDIILFTENGHGRKGFLTTAEVTDFNTEYPTLRLKPNKDCHDRFIVLDYGLETEKIYHCGASSKDAGKKVCTINNLENTEIIHPVIDKLLLEPDIHI